MKCAKDARKLANYFSGLNIVLHEPNSEEDFAYNHIGALYTDIVLQAGLNYNSIVKPRVKNILVRYPNAITTTKFCEVIREDGLESVMNWTHLVKLNRMLELLHFSLQNEIETCSDLKKSLTVQHNRNFLLSINGIGPKTLDYLLRLLSFDTVAVDRHIYSFIEMAEIDANGYHDAKKIVEYAADFLQVSRASMDYSIWKYMSTRAFSKKESTPQLNLF